MILRSGWVLTRSASTAPKDRNPNESLDEEYIGIVTTQQTSDVACRANVEYGRQRPSHWVAYNCRRIVQGILGGLGSDRLGFFKGQTTLTSDRVRPCTQTVYCLVQSQFHIGTNSRCEIRSISRKSNSATSSGETCRISENSTRKRVAVKPRYNVSNTRTVRYCTLYG